MANNSTNFVHPSLLLQVDSNRLINKKAVDVVMPRVLAKVLSWSCSDKFDTETYLQYFKRRGLTNNQLRKTYRIDRSGFQTLENETTSTQFDVTLAVTLINVARSLNQNASGASDDSILNEYLRESKDLRNGVMHGIMDEAIDSNTFHKIKIVLQNLLKEVESLGMTASSNVYVEVDKMVVDMNSILKLTSKEERILQVQGQLRVQGMEETEKYWDAYGKYEQIPFTGEQVLCTDIFYPVEIIKRETNQTAYSSFQPQTLQSPSDILINWNDDDKIPQFTIVIGEAGAGKSTLLKYVANSFMQTSQLNAYDLLLYFRCRERSETSIRDFIRNSIPDTSSKLDMDDILESFAGLKILIMVDGLDELNQSSNLVMNDFLKNASRWRDVLYVATTRPHALREFEGKLKTNKIDYRLCEISEISSEAKQISFLQQYERVCQNKNALPVAQSFTSLKINLKVFLRFPINLVLFYYLFSKSPSTVNNWTNETDIINQILFQYKSLILNKLEDLYIPNLSFVISKLLEMIYYFSFDCLTKNIMTLDEQDLDNFMEKCQEKLLYFQTLQIDLRSILSTIFLTKMLPSSVPKVSYHFFHKSLQEYMASKALIKIHNENPTEKLHELLKTPLESSDEDNSLFRCVWNMLLRVCYFKILNKKSFS